MSPEDGCSMRPDIPGLDDWGDQVLAGQRVLLRADLNLPMRDGEIRDATRIERLVPTIQELRDRQARIGILSHCGRPQGRRCPDYSLAPVVSGVSAAIGGVPVRFADDCIGPAAAACMADLSNGEVALFENLRFHPGEESNDPDFAAALAAQGDFYVNDAFSCSHRSHASITTLAKLLPSVMGRSMASELAALGRVLDSPARPAAALVGGSKVSTKLDILSRIIKTVDVLVVGGGMANTFLLAQGIDVGRSLSEPDLVSVAGDILNQAAGCEILLPVDAVVAPSLAPGVETQVVAVSEVPDHSMILDIGPRGIAAIKTRLDSCRTLLWNGPPGAFETPPFDQATTDIARYVARLTAQGKLISVAGGGDTAAALAHAGVGDDFTYISGAGGAFLEWLEGKELPGITALQHS